jgi:hypothetical protein
MSIRNFFVTSFLAALAAASVFAQGTTSTTTTTRHFIFPPVGLGSTETAQVNVANLATASSNSTAPSCTGSISFANASGAVIGKATAFTVGSNQIVSVSLPFGTSGLAGTHGEVLASVSQTVTFPSSGQCSLVFSLETFATATGETHIVLTNAATSTPIVQDGRGRG